MNSGPVAVIPARGGSKRFPGKNIAELNGKPLIGWTLEAVQDSGVFQSICVTSDDSEILEIAEEFSADIVHNRPDKLAGDDVQLKEVCAHLLPVLKKDHDLNFDTFGLFLPTSPLRRSSDIRKAYEKYTHETGDVLMSVVQFTYPPQRAVCINNGNLEPFFGDEYMVQTQKLQPLFRHDGTFIFADVNYFLSEKVFYRGSVIPFEIPQRYSVDIDEPLDLEWAEFLLEHQDSNLNDE